MLRRFGILVCISLFALAASAGTYQGRQPSAEAKQRYAQAQKLFAMGEKQKALEQLRIVVQLAPQFVEAQRDLIDRQRDKAASLIEPYESKVKSGPDDALAHYLLGKVYSNADKLDKADAEFQKAVDLDRNFGWALMALSNSATRKNDSAQAVELLERASKTAGDSAALHVAIGERFLDNRMDDRALEEVERGLAIDPLNFWAYYTKWRARLNLASGGDEARADVLREVRLLESNHGDDLAALSVAQSAYSMLDDEKGAERAKRAILAIDPKHFDRQDFFFSMWTESGKVIHLSGPSARLLMETNSMKEGQPKLANLIKLEKDVTDQDAKLYSIYPSLIAVHIALKDIGNADRTLAVLEKTGVDPLELADQRITLARAYYQAKGFDAAGQRVSLAVDQLRKSAAAPKAGEPNPRAKSLLAHALALQGAIFLKQGLTSQAAATLDESVKLSEQEDSLVDLGIAYAKLGKTSDAINVLSRAYALAGGRQSEAKAELEKIYPSTADAQPLAARLAEAVERRREHLRKMARDAALAELAKTTPSSAPVFTLATLTGQKVQLSDLRGKLVLLNFWATW